MLWVGLGQCTSPSKTANTAKELENLTPVEVYQLCLETTDTTKKIEWATRVCQKMKNHIQIHDEQHWGGILYDLPRFAEHIVLCKEPTHTSFLDIGAGNGEKLFMALCLGFEKVYGIEYDSTLVKISQENLKNLDEKITLKQADALQVSPSFYAKPDFIYMYSPIKDATKMAELYALVMQNMREGAILLEVRMVYLAELRQKTKLAFPELAGHFILKKQMENFYYLTYQGQEKQWKKILPQN
jgi:16S rRNA G966 N2-methylase RsmD